MLEQVEVTKKREISIQVNLVRETIVLVDEQFYQDLMSGDYDTRGKAIDKLIAMKQEQDKANPPIEEWGGTTVTNEDFNEIAYWG